MKSLASSHSRLPTRYHRLAASPLGGVQQARRQDLPGNSVLDEGVDSDRWRILLGGLERIVSKVSAPDSVDGAICLGGSQIHPRGEGRTTRAPTVGGWIIDSDTGGKTKAAVGAASRVHFPIQGHGG